MARPRCGGLSRWRGGTTDGSSVLFSRECKGSRSRLWTFCFAALSAFIAVFDLNVQQSRAETLVLESHIGARPRETDRLLSPLRNALQKQGFIVTPSEVVKVLRNYRTLPAFAEAGVTSRQLNEAFERAHGDWLDGRVERAATRLEAAVAIAHRSPNLLALSQKTRDLSFSALLSLAQARNRLNQQAKSEAAMAELIRSFPDQLITRSEHGPEAYELYRAVRKGLDAQGRGALIVKVNAPSIVFLDEIPRSQDANGARIADLVAGDYRLLVQSADEPSLFRYYRIPIYAHQVTRLEVSWELDSVLVTEDWVGFRFDTSLQHAKESEAALRVAKETAAPAVVTVRVEVTKQSKLIEASFYELKQQKKTCAGRIRLSGRPTDDTYVTKLAAVLGTCLLNAQAAVTSHTTAIPGSSVTAPTLELGSPRVRATSPSRPTLNARPWVPDDPPSSPGNSNAPAARAKGAAPRSGR